MANKTMNLMELQSILGERIRVTLNTELTPDERETANEQSKIVANLAKQMINNGDLILRAEKLAAQNRQDTDGSVVMGLIGNDEA